MFCNRISKGRGNSQHRHARPGLDMCVPHIEIGVPHVSAGEEERCGVGHWDADRFRSKKSLDRKSGLD